MQREDADDFRRRLLLEWARSEGLDRPVRPKVKARARKKPSVSDKLAAVLLLLVNADGSPMIPVASRATKDAILAVPLQWDHIIALGLEGPDSFDNLRPLSVADHKPKTKADKKRMAHNDRLRTEREAEIAENRRRMLAIPTGDVLPLPKLKKRLKAETHSKMPCGRKSKWKRTMSGKTVLRDRRAA